MELRSESGESSCATSNKTPDIVLSAGDLGAVYLGGINFSTLLAAGRIEEITKGSVSKANLMFSTKRKFLILFQTRKIKNIISIRNFNN